MQTRRSTRASKTTSMILKPNLTTVFKHSKASVATRTQVTKAVTKAVRTKVVETKVERPRRTKKTSSPTPMEIEPITKDVEMEAATKSKVVKPKAPEENPWTKRPLHVPSYADEALDHLRKMDPALGPLINKHPYTIYSDHDGNYFRVLTRTILGQQIHWKAARSIIFKFVSFYFPEGKVTVDSLDSGDKTFPTPKQVLSTSVEKLRLCGLSERKASYVQDLARHFVEKKITFSDKAMLHSMKDEEIASQLLSVKGIGPWTVDMFMMDSLERLDVLPTLDLGVRRGMEKHFKGEYKNGVWGQVSTKVVVDSDGLDIAQIPSKKAKAKGKGKTKNGEMTCDDMERMAERWKPYRSIASWYMWRNADDNGTITAPV
ncbi:3-methyladenine DNA glycosylase [Entomortierella beljakovae]|nr:3-methyladenine DNA glycosylase [Entomortierella beljakovae]